jgi:hypothetical protein
MAMTMRERIARALWEKFGLPGPYDAIPSEQIKSEFMDAADAVLAELETPTDGMVEKGWMELPARADIYQNEFASSFSAAIRASR